MSYFGEIEISHFFGNLLYLNHSFAPKEKASEKLHNRCLAEF